jgi:hypothetical protein
VARTWVPDLRASSLLIEKRAGCERGQHFRDLSKGKLSSRDRRPAKRVYSNEPAFGASEAAVGCTSFQLSAKRSR